MDGVAATDDRGYALTDEQQMTSADGLFAAGDVCVKTLRQVTTAVGQAAQTATDMERYLKAAQGRTGLVPQVPVSRPAVADAADEPAPKPTAEGEAASSAAASALFDEAMLAQLNAVFSRMTGSLVLRLHPDDRTASRELEGYMDELAKLTDKLSVEHADTAEDDAASLPFVEVCRPGGDGAPNPTGLAFHGVPGGHEFTSFVLGLYNAAGPGQPIDDADRAAIAAIADPVRVKVLVSLSCTMCPETVVSLQRIAADNPLVTVDVFDIAHFPDLRERYNAMSVPCVVAERGGAEQVHFGKKNLAQALELVRAKRL